MAASMCCRRLEGLWKINTNMRLQYIGKRTILSDAYRCDKAWKVYLQAPTLREVDAVSFQNEIYNKYQKLKNVSAVDIDILAHVLPSVPPVQLPFTVELFEMFRHCREAVEAKESYHYALIRSCIEMKNEEMLMSMLSKKVCITTGS
ncbi:uncharacterized protein LOC106173786 [Lingula anatina]|uniref:Uncharacterized protein LOC106173786 n=1 Tax=Lingula anatina TaxID=7574 RepID=A0A1S3JJC4_LINAN|nr:uncharacterized protein LOC106173786 [Lingula anatina]|eukprot:XP_013410478.1 uncharacterized protein LOC106173786 [Lingula anatina]